MSGQRGQWGGIAQDNRRFINAVFGVLRTGAPWRDLPPDYGKWGSVHQRFIRWRRKGVWEKLLEILVDEPDYEWLMIDASHIRVHPHVAGAKGDNQDMPGQKGGQHQNTSGRCQRRYEIVRKRRRNFVVFRRGVGNKTRACLKNKYCTNRW